MLLSHERVRLSIECYAMYQIAVVMARVDSNVDIC